WRVGPRFCRAVLPPPAEFRGRASEMTISRLPNHIIRRSFPGTSGCPAPLSQRGADSSIEALLRLPDPRRDLAAQPLQTVQRAGAGFRDLDALDDEMFTEEIVVHGAVMELLRRQHRGEYRH